MDSQTRDLIEEMMKNLKPTTDTYYYGLILTEKTVVSIIKNNPRISVVPLDIKVIFNYIDSNFERICEKIMIFEPLCLPGMSEDYRLNLFVQIEADSIIKIVFITEERNQEI